ncbi:MAG: 3-oxoacyl-ACP reductase family protein [Chloroflexota bacterium]
MGTSRAVALVTGASRGIGRVTALRLADQGFDVAINYRQSAAEAERTVEEVEQRAVRAVALQADVADVEEARVLVDRATEALGALTVLVNNAGVTRDRLLIQMTEDDWAATWQTNLAGARAVSRAAMCSMKERGGRIINLSSVVGASGNAGQANYAAAKSAVLGMTKAFAVQGAASGITVNCVIPGYIVTDATSHLSEEQQNVWLRRIPMGRSARPEEVAEIIAFLAGPGAGYITGQCIAVDGGLLAVSGT